VLTGKGVGSLLTGWLYKEVGIRWAWRIYGISSVVFLSIYFIINRTVFTKSSTEMAENQKELGKCLIRFFSSPELKAQVSFSDRPLSVVCPGVDK
jgi:hypothetical protein